MVDQNEKLIVTIPDKKYRSGVYAIINPLEKRIYIGETDDLFRRFSQHIRSLYGLDNSTNSILKDEFCNPNVPITYELFPLLYCEQRYDKSASNKAWRIDETIYMYLARKIGLELYNEEKDDTGNKRYFLKKGWNDQTAYDQLMGYLEKECGTTINKELINYISQAEKTFKEDLKQYGIIKQENETDWFNITNKNEREKLWNKRINGLTDNSGKLLLFGKVTTLSDLKDVNKKCDLLAMIELTKSNIEELGIHGKTAKDLKELVEGGELERIGILKFGHYFGQGPVTILKTKQYDILQNKLIVENDSADVQIVSRDSKEEAGICFWAFGGAADGTIKIYRDFLSKDNSYKGSRYVIMPYTLSSVYKDATGPAVKEIDLNPEDNESIEDFLVRIRSEKNNWDERFAYGYSSTHKKHDKHKYPDTMFPEVIKKYGKTNRISNAAFLISELSYCDISSIEKDELFKCYTSHTNKPVQKTLKSQNAKCCASLNADKKEEILNKLNSCEKNNSSLNEDVPVRIFIAKIEYPYIIALKNDPINNQ